MIEKLEYCQHQEYCTLIQTLQKPYCTVHYARQCVARKAYDHKVALKRLEDVKDELLEEDE